MIKKNIYVSILSLRKKKMKNPVIRKNSEKNLTIRKFSNKEESSNPVIRKNETLVLVKGDR
jgi:hypothetical protein